MAIPENVINKELGNINIKDEYQKVQIIIKNNFGERVWFLTDACMSVIASLMLEDLPNPIGLNLVDGPSTDKTTVLSFFFGLDFTYRSDDFTPAVFVTQAANVSKERAKDVDLLPKIKHKCLIVPELAPTFGADKDQLLRNFSILTRVFDGQGLKRDGAVHGSRGYEGDYHFTWLGATTPIKPYVWNLMGNLGSRFLFITADSNETHDYVVDKAVKDVLYGESYQIKVDKCKTAIKDYFSQLHLAHDGHCRSVKWNRKSEDPKLFKKIVLLAELTAKIRSNVNVWNAEAQSNKEVDFSIPIIEKPARLISMLYGLARGHAILSGRNKLIEDDMPLVAAIALSSMPDDRRRVLELIASPNHPNKTSPPGTVSSTECDSILGFSRHKAIKVIETLAILRVGDKTDGFGQEATKLTLMPYYNWLYSEEFLKYHRAWEQKKEKEDTQNQTIPF